MLLDFLRVDLCRFYNTSYLNTHTHTHNVPRGNVEGFINKGITDTVQKWGGRCAGHREVVRVSRTVQTSTFFTFPFSARRRTYLGKNHKY